MSILANFGDFPQKTATFQELSISVVAGETTEAWTTVSSCEVWTYTTSSIQLDLQNEFVNQEVGNIIYDPDAMVDAAGQTFDITKTLKAVIDGVDYFIEGKDNISRFSEVEVLLYKKDR